MRQRTLQGRYVAEREHIRREEFKTNDWLIIGGGIGMLIFGTFFDWLSFGGFSGANAFDFFFTGTVPWILLIGAAVITFLRVQGTIKDDALPWPMVLAMVTLLAALLLLIRIVFNPGADGVDRAVGMILSFVSGGVAAAGGVMSFTASGASIKDLADINKIKAAFGGDDDGAGTGGDDMPPPPPPVDAAE